MATDPVAGSSEPEPISDIERSDVEEVLPASNIKPQDDNNNHNNNYKPPPKRD